MSHSADPSPPPRHHWSHSANPPSPLKWWRTLWPAPYLDIDFCLSPILCCTSKTEVKVNVWIWMSPTWWRFGEDERWLHTAHASSPPREIGTGRQKYWRCADWWVHKQTAFRAPTYEHRRPHGRTTKIAYLEHQQNLLHLLFNNYCHQIESWRRLIL